MESAFQWGLYHECEPEELNARYDFGLDKTQAQWWKRCNRGDWLIWQLGFVRPSKIVDECSEIMRRFDKRLSNYFENVIDEHKWYYRFKHEMDYSVKARLAKYINDELRMGVSTLHQASCMWDSISRSEGGEDLVIAEQKMQAYIIHSVIPEWPGVM
jgi:hypothetical protein